MSDNYVSELTVKCTKLTKRVVDLEKEREDNSVRMHILNSRVQDAESKLDRVTHERNELYGKLGDANSVIYRLREELGENK
jgi:chromosome segregation ATPase